MISKLKLGLPLVIFFLLFQFKSVGEVFRMTVSLEVLNDGIRKSLLFSGSFGEIYLIKNLDSNTYQNDIEISFTKPFESPVHLTVFRENSFEEQDGFFYNRTTNKERIITYTYLPENFLLLNNPFNRQHFSQGRIFGKSQEKQTIRIGGVHKLNDVLMQGPFGKVNDGRIKRDSSIKMKFYHAPEEDLSGFIRVNDEPYFRHIFISNQEVMPKKLMINDLEIAHQNAKITLPYKTDWRGNITCENLESGYLTSLTDFTINGTYTKNEFEFPVSNNVILEDFLFTICDWSQYGRFQDTMHFFTKIFEAPETKIFHNPDFGFNIAKIEGGYELEKTGDFDIFELSAYVKFQEEIDLNNIHIYRNAFEGAYYWKIITSSNEKQKLYNFILPKPPLEMLIFLNYPKTLGAYNNTSYGEIEVIKFEFPLPENIEISNQSLYHANFKDSAHKIIVKKHEANN